MRMHLGVPRARTQYYYFWRAERRASRAMRRARDTPARKTISAARRGSSSACPLSRRVLVVCGALEDLAHVGDARMHSRFFAIASAVRALRGMRERAADSA